MSDTDVKPETEANKPLNVQSTPAPAAPVLDGSAAEVEQLRKEAEQAKMRANQLANELDEKRKAEEAQRRKQLEEQEQFKALYEQSEERLRELETSNERKEREAAIASTESTIVTKYPQEVIDIATTAGLKLNDSDETAQKAFVEKLDAIQAKMGDRATVRPNNGNHQEPNTDRAALIEQARTTGDKKAIDEAIGTLGFIKAWKQQ